jgi:hypothetical protein
MAHGRGFPPATESTMTDNSRTRPGSGILFILAGMVAISINDMLIKQMSGGYPLHQIVFTRSAIGLISACFWCSLKADGRFCGPASRGCISCAG